MASVNVKMVEHIIITPRTVEHIIITPRTGMDGKLIVWVITTGKSCLQPCFPVVLDTVFSNGLGIRKD